MNIFFRILPFIVLFELIAIEVQAQEGWDLSSAEVNDRIVLKQLESAIPPSNRDLLQSTIPGHGPLRYRLSTAQGMLFQATNKPFIVRLNADDGLSDRIIGGIPIEQQEFQKSFAWQVALLNSKVGSIFCGGSHIGNGWVVTAAHCIFDEFGEKLKMKDILVLTGTIDLTVGGTRVSLVQDPMVHEQYNPVTKENDIALIRFSSINAPPAVRIPWVAVEAPLISANSNLIVSGWGLTNEAGSISIKLLKVGVPVVNSETCKKSYPGSINSNQVCAGSSGRDSCQGDSGGPLIGRDNDGPVLIGVVSWGKGCGRPGYPGIYTRTVAFQDWIAQKSGG